MTTSVVQVIRSAGGATRWATLQAAGISERALTKAVAARDVVRAGWGTYATRAGRATVRDPWPVTTVAQTVADCARILPFADALVILDSALRNGRVLLAGDRRSASIGETLVRASALETGLPGPDLQHPVTFDDGTKAYLDLAWPDYRGRAVKLAVEFDGYSGHGKVDFVKDRRRHNKLVMRGWSRLIYTLPDVEKRYPAIGAEIRHVLDDRWVAASAQRVPVPTRTRPVAS